MFPRPQRLTNRRLFERLFRQGIWVHGRTFSLRFVSAQGGGGQIAFVVSRKLARDATVRNRIKRQLRAAFQAAAHAPQLTNLLKGHHLIVVAQKPTRGIPFTSLKEESRHLLSKLAERQGQ